VQKEIQAEEIRKKGCADEGRTIWKSYGFFL
jgi:hypothetical protein